LTTPFTTTEPQPALRAVAGHQLPAACHSGSSVGGACTLYKVARRDALAAVCALGATDLAHFDPDPILVAPILPTRPDAGLQARITAYTGNARDTVTLDNSFSPVFPPGVPPYPPKYGSWLNQAEIEMSIVGRGYLLRPVGDVSTL